MAIAYTTEYRILSITDAGNDRVVVNLQQDVPEVSTPASPTAAPYYGSTVFGINMNAADAAGFFPGQVYKVDFTKKV